MYIFYAILFFIDQSPENIAISSLWEGGTVGVEHECVCAERFVTKNLGGHPSIVLALRIRYVTEWNHCTTSSQLLYYYGHIKCNNYDRYKIHMFMAFNKQYLPATRLQ